jgi:hypothetical protein
VFGTTSITKFDTTLIAFEPMAFCIIIESDISTIRFDTMNKSDIGIDVISSQFVSYLFGILFFKHQHDVGKIGMTYRLFKGDFTSTFPNGTQQDMVSLIDLYLNPLFHALKSYQYAVH